VGSFYVVTPLETQQKLVNRMMEHWLKGYGAEYNPTRKEALLNTRVVNVLDDAVADITQRRGEKPRTVIPDAKPIRRARSPPVRPARARRVGLLASGSVTLFRPCIDLHDGN